MSARQQVGRAVETTRDVTGPERHLLVQGDPKELIHQVHQGHEVCAPFVVDIRHCSGVVGCHQEALAPPERGSARRARITARSSKQLMDRALSSLDQEPAAWKLTA